MTDQLVFILINSNHEGYNFKGVYSTREKAEAAAKEYNEEGKKELANIFTEEKDLKCSLEHFDWWSSVKVVEWKLNTRRSP